MCLIQFYSFLLPRNRAKKKREGRRKKGEKKRERRQRIFGIREEKEGRGRREKRET